MRKLQAGRTDSDERSHARVSPRSVDEAIQRSAIVRAQSERVRAQAAALRDDAQSLRDTLALYDV